MWQDAFQNKRQGLHALKNAEAAVYETFQGDRRAVGYDFLTLSPLCPCSRLKVVITIVADSF